MTGDMPSGGAGAKAFFRGVSDFIWPPRSLVSGERGTGRGPLSPAEFAQLRFISDPLCDRCGIPLDYRTGDETWCVACLARPPRWDRARAALVYDDVSRRPVLDLKRSGRRDGLATFAGWMGQVGGPLIDTAELIVPVPLHYTRLVMRGFNQSGWLAQAVAKASGKPVLVDALVRTRRTPSQAGLARRARRRNVTGAFKVRKGREGRIAGAHVLLVDDVLTTGATLSACTRALKRAGARQVDVLVLARVVRETDITI
ncbi:ComF family protein [Hyphomonas sp.]|uniref:ComF family protein n=1 Tax=Hyphomonas sp. TaxID=87 RepID=UPI003918E597